MSKATYVGIDVSKDKLDVAIGSDGEEWQVSNEEDGHAELRRRLSEVKPALIVMEASGGYEAVAAGVLWVAGLQVAVVNPAQVREFARGVGKKAKTDRIDARLLAFFAETVRPPVHAPADEEAEELKGPWCSAVVS